MSHQRKRSHLHYTAHLTTIIILLFICAYLIYIATQQAGIRPAFKNIATTSTGASCSKDSKVCSDGSIVYKDQIRCTFPPCPEDANRVEGWKTYINNSLHFEIQYPPSLKPFEMSEADQFGVQFKSNVEAPEPLLTMKLTVIPVTIAVDLKNWIQIHRTYTGDIKSIILGKMKGFSYDSSDLKNGITENVAVYQDNKIVIFSLLGGGIGKSYRDSEQSQTTFLKMLTTFTFLINQKANPTNVTEQFYNWYVNCLESNLGRRPDFRTVCSLEKNSIASTKLFESQQKIHADFTKKCKTDSCSLGDTIICAVNVPSYVTVDSEKLIGNFASVIAHGVFSDGSNNIQVNLEKKNDQWKITNISCNR